MKFFLSLIALFCFFPAQAEVIIYKHSLNRTWRTDGPAILGSKATFSGWTVIDIQTGQLGLVTIIGDGFDIQQPASDIASFTRAHRAKAVGVLAIRDGEMSGLIAKGNSKSMDIGLDQNWSIPRTLVVKGSHVTFSEFSNVGPWMPGFPAGPATPTDVSPAAAESEDFLAGRNPTGFFPGPIVQTNNFSLNSTDFEQLSEYKGSMVFDRASTLRANGQNMGLAAALLHFKNLLLEKGYIFQGPQEEEGESELILHESNPL